MTALRKGAALLLAALICFGLGGCGILPSEEYNDYDVSGYIQALLDSSYHNSHQAFVSITQAEEGSAMANYTTTVENAAINFCNAYSLELNDEQMGRLEDVMAKVLLSARYQVKDEVKTETGYTIDVTVSPITNFAGLTGEFTTLRSQAQEAADRTSMVNMGDDEDGSGDDEDGGWEEDGSGEEPTPTPAPTPQAKSATELYVDSVLDLCEAKAASVEFGGTDTLIVMDIRLTEDGKLQLDLNQLDEIDRALLVFQQTAPVA